MTVPAEAVLSLGAFVGILSGIFGVGGGFLMTPFLIFMGLPPAVAVGTQAGQLVASSLSGLLGHMKRKNVDFKMGGIMLSGSIIGSIVGVMVFRALRHAGQIDLVIPVLYIFLLGGIGVMMLTESLSSLLKKKSREPGPPRFHANPIFRSLPFRMEFPLSRIHISALIPAVIGFVGGMLVSILGIGGGFLMVPAMIYILGMPMLLVAGTSLFQIFVTTIITTIMQAAINHSVDITLAFMLIVGGVIGAQIGVRVAPRIKEVYARVMLAVMLLLVGVQMCGALLMPHSILRHMAESGSGDGSGLNTVILALARDYPLVYGVVVVVVSVFFGWGGHAIFQRKASPS